LFLSNLLVFFFFFFVALWGFSLTNLILDGQIEV
jgi:hypothetical protein